jgi:hypothetical protein
MTCAPVTQTITWTRLLEFVASMGWAIELTESGYLCLRKAGIGGLRARARRERLCIPGADRSHRPHRWLHGSVPEHSAVSATSWRLAPIQVLRPLDSVLAVSRSNRSRASRT